ncbi:hypothetical protein H4S07_001726 [Coemansia furcata]|uniref:Uncharacterized protein n=1 Tax=Coemansia furcata TaxID=417177 RepID=A0ACC1LMM2_9FUNG|nr:hypothetical protein H4S07_001726 [Coemansia furcata]
MARSGRSGGRSSFGGSSRSAHTMAAPAPMRQAAPPAPVQHAPATAQPQQPSMFAQMAATAGGVAVGSAIGHTVGAAVTGMFSGGSSDSSAQQQQQAPLQSSAYGHPMQQQQANPACDADIRAYISCLDSTNQDAATCKYYLDRFKMCQANIGSM